MNDDAGEDVIWQLIGFADDPSVSADAISVANDLFFLIRDCCERDERITAELLPWVLTALTYRVQHTNRFALANQLLESKDISTVASLLASGNLKDL